MSVTFWTIVSRSSVEATTAPTSPSFSVFAACSRRRREQTGPLRDVAGDLRGADDLASLVSDAARPSARSTAACRPCAAGSSRSGRLVSPARILASTTSSSPCSSSGISMRIDCPMASVCGVAEHALGGGIPRRDDAVQILGDDRVVRRFDDRRQPPAGDGAPARAR